MLYFGIITYAFCFPISGCHADAWISKKGLDTEQQCIDHAKSAALFVLQGIPNLSYSIRCIEREAQG